MLKDSWNTSVKIMFDLPIQTHRCLIEPVSQSKHLKFILLERFLSFLNQIANSKKLVPKHLLHFSKHDVRLTTSSNLRNLLLLTEKNSIEELCKDDIRNLKYNQIEKKDAWKVGFIHEITDLKLNKLKVEGFSEEELEEILAYLCTA